jgi:hypothetical protein
MMHNDAWYDCERSNDDNMTISGVITRANDRKNDSSLDDDDDDNSRWDEQ